MSLEQILIIILIGAVAGWLGSFLAKGRGLGLLGNVIVGILGSFVGTWLLRELHVTIGSTPLINVILTGAIGAFVIVFLMSLVAGRR